MSVARGRSFVVAAVLAAPSSLVGCATTGLETVRDTASAQWGCPAEQVAVSDRGEGHFDAQGCGRRGRFATHPPNDCPSPGCRGTSQGI